jgi:hypothetical protein
MEHGEKGMRRTREDVDVKNVKKKKLETCSVGFGDLRRKV